MKHALKEIMYNWKKYLMVEMLVILLIFMVVFLTGLANGLGKAMSSGIENLNSNHFLIATDSEKMIGVSSIDERVMDTLLVNNETFSPLTIQHTLIQLPGMSDKIDATYFVLDPDKALNVDIIEGSFLDSGLNSVVVDESLVDSTIAIGSKIIDVETEIELTVVGTTQGQSYSHTPVMFISYDTYTEMIQSISEGAKVKVNALAVANPEIQIDDYEVLDKTTIVENMPGFLAEQLTIKMIIWVLVIVSAAILAVFFYILTLQKMKQFGVLKAIGFSMTKIASIQLSQISAVSFFGAFIGFSAAIGLGKMMPSTMPFFIDYKEVSFVTLAFIAIAIFSSLLSIFNIGKIDPVSVIGGSED